MSRLLVCAVLASFVFAVVSPHAAAELKKVEITKKWSGSVEDEKKWSGSVEDEKAIKPECITSTKGLEAVWKAWKIDGDVPKIDFTKDIVVAVYSPGSKLNMAGANLDDTGDLAVLGFGTMDIRPGFRYVLGVVSKEGVKTVNRKALPKE
jgi:hypothetical protein